MKIDLLLMLIISGILVYICYTDIRWRLISNNMTALLLLLSIIFGWASCTGLSIVLPVAILIVGFFLAAQGIIGAGDVKLMSALSVGLSTDSIIDFLLLTSLLGVPLTLLTFLYYWIALPRRALTIPYGVALSAGYWWQYILHVH